MEVAGTIREVAKPKLKYEAVKQAKVKAMPFQTGEAIVVISQRMARRLRMPLIPAMRTIRGLVSQKRGS